MLKGVLDVKPEEETYEALLSGYVAAQDAGLASSPPALFTDPAFARSTNFALSTSNMSTPGYGPEYYDFCGFGAYLEQSYGVCYAIQDSAMTFTITSRSGCETRDATRFRRVIEVALDDTVSLLEAAAEAQKRASL